MAATKKLLAIDLGAESGRCMLGLFDGERLRLEGVYRFANRPVWTLDTLHWDVLHLYSEILTGLRKAATQGPLDGLGVDTWGVDFALLGRGGTLLGNPRHYRDPHTENIPEQAFSRVSREDIFRQTGIQFLRFNTLYQLLALQQVRSPLLDVAETLLFMPDLFHYFLTGIKVNELTDASTSQMVDPLSRSWAFGLVKAFGLPTNLLGTIVQPGTVLGPLRNAVAADTGLNPVPVIAPASHDTAAAVAAVPASATSWGYISSGTWSLMGVEHDTPLLTEAALINGFTNEAGVDGTLRVLRNIAGLWLVQECRRAWERSGIAYTYEELAWLAEAAPAFTALVDPDDPSFLLPANMPDAVADYCRQTRQPVLVEPGAVVRCILESLALRYRWTMIRLEEMTGRNLEVVHVVGGGSQNQLLCQFTADACDRPVLAGPVEATAIGNLMSQAVGLGLLGSWEDARALVRRSFEVRTYTPRQPANWHEPYSRFIRLLTAKTVT
jgi:rhamnulokinase